MTAGLLANIRAAAERGHDPLVVFDLDETLYSNDHRTLRILQEYAHTHAARLGAFYDLMGRLSPGDVHYGVATTLRAAGVRDDALIADVQAFWAARFFTNAYAQVDLARSGAVELVNLVYEAGGVPCYLTGRDAPGMLLGTVTALQRDGFPIGTVDTRTILKPDATTPDAVYKAAVITHLRRTGDVVGAFDNEPGLCNLFKRAFPQATVVWVDSSHAPGAPTLDADIATVRHFTELLPARAHDRGEP
ncbi:MAG: hypothetical protein EP329_22275 [Deltaproteobacteria bacterium]|nr:MAG: hypothetical protein EP329_22275 [Deltaproteobacteria bacterium]